MNEYNPTKFWVTLMAVPAITLIALQFVMPLRAADLIAIAVFVVTGIVAARMFLIPEREIPEHKRRARQVQDVDELLEDGEYCDDDVDCETRVMDPSEVRARLAASVESQN